MRVPFPPQRIATGSMRGSVTAGLTPSAAALRPAGAPPRRAGRPPAGRVALPRHDERIARLAVRERAEAVLAHVPAGPGRHVETVRAVGHVEARPLDHPREPRRVRVPPPRPAQPLERGDGPL